MRNLVLEEESFEESSNSGNLLDNDLIQFPLDESRRKIVDLKKLLKDRIDRNDLFCSFELFPVKKNNEIYARFFTEMSKFSPLFYALTWHTKDTSKNYPSLELLESFPSNTLLHLAAKGLTRADVEIILEKAVACGVTNVFALRGDSPVEGGDFAHAVDLVNFIRTRFGDRFCICVAGYPEMHPESPSKELDLFYLKEKVDAGAHFIITQILFDPKVFINFVQDCRRIGINVPIIPGIFPIPDYKCLKKMTSICSVTVPKKILDILEPVKNNDEAIRNYGINLAVSIIKDIIKSGTTCGFHLFTLNRASLSSEICTQIQSQ